MNVVAVVGMRWIARGARTGPASVTLWALAWIAFFVPLAVACSALAKKLSRTGRRVHLGAPRLRAGARVHLRLVPLGQQPLLLSVAAALWRREFRGDGRRPAWEAMGDGALVLGRVRAGRHLDRGGHQHHRTAARQVAAERRQPRRVDSGRPADGMRRVRVRAIRIGDAVHAAHDGPARRPARHDRPLVGDVLRVLGIRDHLAHRPGNPRPRADDSARHLHRRRGDDGDLHRRVGVRAGRGAGRVAEGAERDHRRGATGRGTGRSDRARRAHRGPARAQRAGGNGVVDGRRGARARSPPAWTRRCRAPSRGSIRATARRMSP